MGHHHGMEVEVALRPLSIEGLSAQPRARFSRASKLYSGPSSPTKVLRMDPAVRFARRARSGPRFDIVYGEIPADMRPKPSTAVPSVLCLG
jgi:hypothetical protein